MVKWFQAALGAIVLSLLACLPATGQSAKGIDLPARLLAAQTDPKLADVLFKTGRNVAAVCVLCHGEGGNSAKPDVPNLAGQNPAYLLEQLQKFTDGRRRYEFMEGMIKAMSSDEKVGIVLFYSAQKAKHQSVGNSALVAKGKDYYNKICFRCHGDNGRGNEKIARIAGQQPDYLSLTLKRYRAGTGERVDPLMAANTKGMSDADVDAVVAFVASME